VAEQTPPGRAGRPWLRERIAIATHGLDLLRQKQQLLSREQRRLVQFREETAREWAAAAGDADRWAARAGALSGTTATRLAGASTRGRAEVTISWRNTMGAQHPDEARVVVPTLDALNRAVNAAVGPSAEAHGRALGAAARQAVVESALRAVEAELSSTRRRLRAIERHRLPQLEGELHALNLRLDEVEREERLVTRWAAQHLAEGGPG
jgi:V/A-type H+-transporting ATPase subunit D